MAVNSENAAAIALNKIAISVGSPTIPSEDVWGGCHRALGRITREELSTRYAWLLDAAGVDAGAFPAEAYWIVDQDCDGGVSAAGYPDVLSYSAALEDFTARWEAASAQ